MTIINAPTVPIVSGVDLGGRKLAISYYIDGAIEQVTAYDVLNKDLRAHQLFSLMSAVTADPLFMVCDYFFIEEPLVGRGVRSSLQLAQTAGALLHEIGRQGYAYSTFVPVSTWKLSTVGSGNASKEHVRTWLKVTHPDISLRCSDDQDLVDAACVGLYGTRIVTQSRTLHLHSTTDDDSSVVSEVADDGGSR